MTCNGRIRILPGVELRQRGLLAAIVFNVKGRFPQRPGKNKTKICDVAKRIIKSGTGTGMHQDGAETIVVDPIRIGSDIYTSFCRIDRERHLEHTDPDPANRISICVKKYFTSNHDPFATD